jgi:transketolase
MVGEDGPTHQPVEHLAAVRAIPNLVTLRPADANEVSAAWKVAIERRNAPTLLALTRQNVPVFDREKYATASELEKGAYVMADLGPGTVQLVLMATGSEVELIVKAAETLAAEGVSVRVISMPSWELFEQQPKEYQDAVLMPEVKARLGVEAGVSMGWHKWVGLDGKLITIDRFGASAPSGILAKELGLTVENVLQNCRELLAR